MLLRSIDAFVAHASCTGDNIFMDVIGKEFVRNPLDTFRVFFGGRRDARDVDTESHSVNRLVNCAIGLESIGINAARSRPNVPMLGDDAAALLSAFYDVDQVKSSINFEAVGLKFALLSFDHFDLDGLGAKSVMVAEGKRVLDPQVFVSKRHCGNHARAVRSMHIQRCG